MNLLNLILTLVGLYSYSILATQQNTDIEPLHIVISANSGGRSHIQYLLEISKILRERGHSITYATSENNYKFNKPYNYTLFNIGGNNMNDRQKMKSINLDKGFKMDMNALYGIMAKAISKSFDISFHSYEKLFTTQKVDLIICDFFNVECSEAARKHLVPVMIGFQGLNFGIAAASYLTTTLDNTHTTTDHYKFYQRFKSSVIDELYNYYKYLPMVNAVNEARFKYGIPSHHNPWGAFDQIMKLTNTYIGFDDPRPIPSTVKLIGPVTDDNGPPLDIELKNFLNSKRVMYVAFGSNVILSKGLIQKLLSAIQLSIEFEFIDGVIWGLGNTYPEDFPSTFEVNDQQYPTSAILEGTHPTIKALKWAPQISILNHPSTKLFISHGGIESLHEGIHSGTPILCMPIFADQPRNGRLIKNRGIGDFIETSNTNAEDIYEKIKELVRDDNLELQANVKHIQAISKANNDKRLENAKFLEHYAMSARICRMGIPPKPFEIPCEMEPYIQADSKMSFIAAYKIDILLSVVAIGFISTGFILYFIMKLVIRFASGFFKNGEKVKDE